MKGHARRCLALVLAYSAACHELHKRVGPRCEHRTSLARLRVSPTQLASQTSALRALRLRGGSDAGTADNSERLPTPTENADGPLLAEGKLPTPPPERQERAEAVTCWSMLKQIFTSLVALFSPTYEYAKVQTDVLGDATQMCGFVPDDESWRQQRKKLHVVELQPAARKRVLRDLRRLKQDPDLGVEIDDAECLTDWIVKMTGAPGTIYEGEIYRLRFRFHLDYPQQPPEVTFMRPAPVHEHIYSDGKICLNILYSDWEPKLDVCAVCLSLRSMLSSAKKKSRPPDNNSTVVMSRGQKTRNMQWEFHDDNC